MQYICILIADVWVMFLIETDNLDYDTKRSAKQAKIKLLSLALEDCLLYEHMYWQ